MHMQKPPGGGGRQRTNQQGKPISQLYLSLDIFLWILQLNGTVKSNFGDEQKTLVPETHTGHKHLREEPAWMGSKSSLKE